MIFNENKKQNVTVQCIPNEVEQSESVQFPREDVEYKNLSEKYLLGSKKQSACQYFKMYTTRLELMRPRVEEKAKEKWSTNEIKKLHELTDGSGVCIIVGTLFKKQDLKPSILKELSEDNQLMPQPVLEKFASESDEIILEDELQRIQLKNNLPINELVTGIVCAVKGHEESAGKFFVEDICFAGLPEIPSNPINTDKYVVFISGLELNNETSYLSLQMFIDYITGHAGDFGEQEDISNIVRVVIAGNSICGSSGEDISLTEKVKLVKLLDDLLLQISLVCPIDLMPGEYDPANYVMPQQPFHHCIFPQAIKSNTIQSVPNPYEFELGGRTCLGTSGQNVKNIGQCSTVDDPLQILENVCKWGHLAPSAPDTLLSYPYNNGSEPFVMDNCPDIVFAGNQNSLSSKLISDHGKTQLLLSLPKFSRSNSCVLVNLKTLDTVPLKFTVGHEDI